MATADGADARSEASPLNERFSLDDVINGLAGDLAQLRAGRISIEDARVRAELGKQIIAGVRTVVSAQKVLEARAKEIGKDDG